MTHALPGYVCAEDGTRADARTAPWCCPVCGGPWDLDFAPDPAAVLDPAAGPHSLWRYGPALPLTGAFAVTLAEGNTPLVPLAERVHAKLDFLMPTLSFKDRGAVMLAELARRWGRGGWWRTAAATPGRPSRPTARGPDWTARSSCRRAPRRRRRNRCAHTARR